MGRRSNIDWEAIERDYRIGKLSLRQMVDKHGVAMSSISSKAKEKGWTRDLTETVRAATKAAMIEQAKQRAVEIGEEIGAKNGVELVDGIHSAVTENVRILNEHIDTLRDLGQLISEGKRTIRSFVPNDVREAKVIVDMIASISTSTRVHIEMQRKAHGLDEVANKTEIEELLEKVGRA